jgi:hypothetical protein
MISYEGEQDGFCDQTPEKHGKTLGIEGQRGDIEYEMI